MYVCNYENVDLIDQLYSIFFPLKCLLLGLCEGDCDNDDHCEGDMTCEHRENSQRIAGCSGAPILKGSRGYDYCTDAKYTTKLFPCGCFLWKYPDWPDVVRYNPDTNQCNNGSNNEINSGLLCKKVCGTITQNNSLDYSLNLPCN